MERALPEFQGFLANFPGFDLSDVPAMRAALAANPPPTPADPDWAKEVRYTYDIENSVVLTLYSWNRFDSKKSGLMVKKGVVSEFSYITAPSQNQQNHYYGFTEVSLYILYHTVILVPNSDTHRVAFLSI